MSILDESTDAEIVRLTYCLSELGVMEKTSLNCWKLLRVTQHLENILRPVVDVQVG